MLGLPLAFGVGVGVGADDGVAPTPPGGSPGVAGMPPLVLHAETPAQSAAVSSSVNSDLSTRVMAQAGYLWSIRAYPARVEP